MFEFEKKKDRSYSPGEIIYVDSNFHERYDCFGVVVDRDFWIEQVEKENVFKEHVEELKRNGIFEKFVLFRVLGTKSFRQYWRANDENEFEPDEHAIMHYRCQAPVYVEPVDLRPIIETSKKDDRRVGRLLFSNSDLYVSGALNDAEIIYRYLDGERFNPDKKYNFREDKLLRLLEKAVPL